MDPSVTATPAAGEASDALLRVESGGGDRDTKMATNKGRRAELVKLQSVDGTWSFYRSTCQFRLGYFSFLVMMVIVMFSFAFLMEIFFAIFLPSARSDPYFTERSIVLLGVLPFALILLSYVFEESSRLFLDAIDKSEGSLGNFRLSLTVVLHYLRHREEMPDDRLLNKYTTVYHTVDEDAEAWKRVINSFKNLFRRFMSIFLESDPFDDTNKELEDIKRQELELAYKEAEAEGDVPEAAQVANYGAAGRWKKAMAAASTAVAFKKTSFDGPPLDYSTLVMVDLFCPVLFEVVTLWHFVTKLLSTLSPMEAFFDYITTGFYTVAFYLVVWLVCHFWSARNRKMREFVSNYRRRRRDLKRALREMEYDKKSENLWLVDIGFRSYELFESYFFSAVRFFSCGRSRRNGTAAERVPLAHQSLEERAAANAVANETDETVEGMNRLYELHDRLEEWNPWHKFSYNRRLMILCPLVVVSALISFSAFFFGWTVMGFCLILLAYTIQGRFPQIFGTAFRSFITCFVVLSFVFFSSTWAIGTFVDGGDFKVLPPATSSSNTTNNMAIPAVEFNKPMSVWGKIAQYPVCSLEYYSLDIVDFALIADAAYGRNKSVQFNSLQERFKGTELDDWKYVRRNNDSIDHQVWIELFFPSVNLTVVAVRGTASAADALEDLHYWFGISIMQAVDVFMPFLKQLPTAFVVQMLSLNVLSPVMPPPVYSTLLEHVQELKTKVGDRLVLTGHSLGGAMAAMVGAKTKSPAVSFSGPGLLFSRGRFGVEEKDIRDYVLTIKPRTDIVPQVDELGGMVQEIECRRTNPLACHSTITHLCELHASCGDHRNRDWSQAEQCKSYLNPSLKE